MRIGVIELTTVKDQDRLNHAVIATLKARIPRTSAIITPLAPGLGFAAAHAALTLDLHLTVCATAGQELSLQPDEVSQYHEYRGIANDVFWTGYGLEGGGFGPKVVFCQSVACMTQATAILTVWDGQAKHPAMSALEWLGKGKTILNVWTAITKGQ